MNNISEQRGKALKAGAWYTVANILFRAVSIITAPIFTRLLTTADYGVVSNFTSWQNIIGVFTTLCAGSGIGRARLEFEKRFDGYLASVQMISTISSILGLSISVLFSDRIAAMFSLDKELIVAMFVYLCFYPSLRYRQETYRFEYKYFKNMLISIYNTFFVVGISLILIIFTDMPGYDARIIGMIVPAIVLGMIYYVQIFVRGIKEISVEFIKFALRIGLPLIPHQLAMTVLGQIDRIMIVRMVGESEAGIYGFGYSYAVIVSIVINAVGQAWEPLLYEYLQRDNTQEIKRINNSINQIVAVCTIIFITFGPEAIMLLGAKPFWEAKWMVAPVAIGTFFQYLYSNFSMVEIYSKKTIWIALGSIMAALVNYFLNYLLIPVAGYHVAAMTTMVGYLCLMIFHWIFSIKTYGKFVYDTKSIVITCLLVTVGGFVIMGMYDMYLLRYAVALFFIAYPIYRNRDYIFKLIKKYLRKQ